MAIRIIDLETTGINSTDHVVEVGSVVLRYWLNLDMDRSIADRAHRAMPDGYVTAHLLREILKHASIEDLIRWTDEPGLLPKVTFGKYRGQNWTDVPPDYLQWILRQQDMNEDVVYTAHHHLANC